MSIKQGAGIKEPKKEATASDLEQLKKLLEENINLTKELEERVSKIHGYIKFLRVWGIIKILIILIPIILGIIYLPPILNDLISQYQGIFEGLGELNQLNANIDINSILNGL